MKVLPREEGVLWCRANRVTLNGRGLPEIADAESKFRIPADTGKRVHLVKQAMEPFTNERAILVWFDNWSVWPSGQRMHIFDRLRRSYGEIRRIADVPVQLFEKSEIEDAISFVTIAVFFLWDCYVVGPDQDRLLFFSHDEYVVTKGINLKRD